MQVAIQLAIAIAFTVAIITHFKLEVALHGKYLASYSIILQSFIKLLTHYFIC